MSNLLKSKYILGFMIVAVLLVGAFAFTAKADCSLGSTTLKYGQRSAAVTCLQTYLNVTPATGYFGKLTLAAVKAFQANHSPLTADGKVGTLTKAAITAGGVVPNTQSLCPNGMTLASNCTVAPVPGTIPAQTGPVSVTLATDNPASGSFIAPASGVVFAKYTFTGAGTVTSLKLQRTGVSSSSTLNNVYLYDGATRLTDGASIGSDNTVTFNSLTGLFTVAGSRTISIVADTLTADYSLGFTLVGYTANGTASTVSVAGNQMYGASAALATIAMTSATGSGNTDAGTDITVWQGTATVSTRDVLLKSLALRNIGSIATSDINDFKLYIDGVLTSTIPTLDSNGYVTFPVSVALKTGARTLEVTADVLGGSGRTVQFSLRGAYDLQDTDTQYNANGTTTGTFPFGPAAFTVNSGTMTVVKTTDSQSSNITLGASDQSLAKYTFTAYGEPIKVETLKVGMITNGTVATVSLRNVRILVNGAQVGSNTTVPAAASFAANTGTQFTTNFIVYPGTPATVEIHSDLVDNNGTDQIANGNVTTIQAVLVGGAGSSNATPQISLGTINTPTAANVAGNNLTISSGSMSVAKTASYSNRSIAVPATAYKIGSYQLSGNSTEPVNLNTLYVGFTGAMTGTPATDLSDLYVVYGGTQSTVKGTVSSTILNGNSWSVNKTLGVNETMQIDVYATIASSLSTNNIITTLAVAGTTANSGVAYYADSNTGNTTLDAGAPGQTITGASGSVTLSQDSSTALAQIIDDNGTVKSLTGKIVALTDSYTVTDMTVTVSNVSAVSTATLKYHDAYNGHAAGEVIGAAKSAQTSMTWSGLNLQILAGDTVKVDVELALAPVGVNGGTTGASLQTAISAFTARSSAGTSASGTGSATGNVIYIYKAIPTLSLVSMPTGTGTLSAGTATLSKFSVNTNGSGTVSWNRIIFTIAKTSAPILTFSNSTALYNADSGTLIPGTVTVIDSAGAASCLATLTACDVQFIPTNEEQVTGTKNYALKTTVSGTLVSTDYVTTSIANTGATLGYVAPAAYLTVAPATGVGSFDTYAHAIAAPTFVWSDVSKASHDTTTLDWNNDYLVRSLPLDSQTLHM